MNIELRTISKPADDRGRDEQDEDGDPRSVGVGQQGGEERAAGRSDEEDVQRAERRAHASQPVRHHRAEDRPDHGERRRQQHRAGDGEDGEEPGVRHEVLDRRERRGRQDDEAHEPQRLRRVSAIQPVIGPADERQRGEHRNAANGGHRTPAERAEPVLLLQEEAGQHRRGEQAEAHRRERDDGRAQRVDLQQPGERRFHRDRRRLVVLGDGAEHVLLLVLAPRRLRQPERRQRGDARRDGEEQERPPPSRAAAGERGDAADEHGAQRPGRRTRQLDAGEHPPAASRSGTGRPAAGPARRTGSTS